MPIGREIIYYNLIHLDDAVLPLFAADNHERLMHQTHNPISIRHFAEVIRYLAELTGGRKPNHFPAWLPALSGRSARRSVDQFLSEPDEYAYWLEACLPSYQEGSGR